MIEQDQRRFTFKAKLYTVSLLLQKMIVVKGTNFISKNQRNAKILRTFLIRTYMSQIY